jgi:hypothetical protein
MKNMLAAAFLFSGLCFSGCTYSIRPILTEKELVHDIDLNGNWQADSDKPEKATDKPALIELKGFDENSSYDFEFPSSADPGKEFVMRVGKLGDVTVAEFAQLDPVGPPIAHGLPVYVVSKLELKNDTLTLRELDDPKCRKALDEDKVPYFVYEVGHRTGIEQTVMLAPTAQIQEFLRRRHAEVFTGRVHVFRRQVKEAAKK